MSSSSLCAQVCSFANLLRAFLRAAAGKRRAATVSSFSWRREEELWDLHTTLVSDTYEHGAYRTFIVNDSKKRLIKAAPFKDRIVHHALCAYLEPIFDRGFIFDSYACRTGKGTHKALSRLERWKPHFSYALSCDISRYFATIDHDILMGLLQKKVRDARILALCNTIIESAEDAPGKGIPIGNLTSQLFANIYLNELDQFVKHTLRVRFYIRYMDDLIILSNSKEELHDIRRRIEHFVHERLALTLHPKKTVVFHTKGGIDFLGYRLLNGYRRLRKSTVKRFIKRTKHRIETGMHTEDPDRFYAGITSWLAYATRAKSWHLRRLMTWLPWKRPPANNS